MIYGELSDFGRYAALGAGFKAAADWLKNTDLAALPVGKTEIAGADVYASVSEYDTKAADAFEAHDLRADIQIMLFGRERIDYCKRAGLAVVKDNLKEKDCVKLAEGGEFLPLEMSPGKFAVFFPEDAHRPGVALSDPEPVKKLVIKILL